MELKDISAIANQMTMKKVGGKQQQQQTQPQQQTIPPVRKANSAPKRKLRELRESGTQTASDDRDSDVDLVTGVEPPKKYSRLQAEAKDKMIHQLLQENEKLQTRIEYLEKENFELETMLEDAKKLADMISSMPDDPDESGIVRDHSEED